MNRIAEFGKVVRAMRRERGLSQEQLAEKASLHVNSISFLERGLTPPALDTICAIADALEVKVSLLITQMEAGSEKSKPAKS